MTVLDNIVDYIFELELGKIPDEVVHKAKILILHHLYTGFSGVTEFDSQIAFRLLNKHIRDSGNSTVLGQKEKHSAVGASFINAVLMHSVQMEDTYKGLHPGPHTIPSAFALGEEHNTFGADIIASIVAGYEINIHVGEACMKYSSARGWRGTTIYGVLGSASTAARTLGLDRAKTASAIANATNLASGLMECWLSGTSEWLFTSGLAAQNGVISALIAGEGGSGAATSFEGEKGFIGAYCDRKEVDIDSLTNELGKRYCTSEVALKPYAVITTILPVIHNVLELAKQESIAHDAIEKVTITAGPRITNGPLMKSILDYGPYVGQTQAYKSLPCAIGIGLVHGNVSVETVPRYGDASVFKTAEKVEIATDASFEGFHNQVEIKTDDGVLHVIDGDDFPSLSDERVLDNFRIGAAKHISMDKVENLIDMILDIESTTMDEISKNLS